jgi:transporter family protein
MKDTFWILPSLLAAISWGVWGLFGKLAGRELSPPGVFVVALAGQAILAVVAILIFRQKADIAWGSVSFFWALAAGLCGGTGTIFYYLALSKGEVSKAVILTAMYPVVTVVLSVLLLGERFNGRVALALCLSLVSVWLLSKE